ncbi:DEAD/DEAH box helicase [Gephyromycinifex aptenodytis]|uniref:DEAD/DEAH box helicase n=1 Tax=Gephyromycinifex aptenodytis TaxID=2716227 RepID=UPI001447B943|nr:DEAD/DEAH box helicase [Gephyromycinifex aptenodytis]
MLDDFGRLGVPAPLVKVLTKAGITTPTPIQAATLPDSLAGRDVLGRGRTGSGKTYAFLLPMLARLAQNPAPRKPKSPRALVLVPTRELARQIEAALAPLAEVMGMRTLVVFGGVGANPQVQGLRRGVDILIACPGRLEDLMSQGHCRLDAVEIAVLDEADHMADLGFLPVVKRLLDRTPSDGQRLLFSATLDTGVDVLVRRYLHNPVTHHADSAQSPISNMDHHVLHIGEGDRLGIVAALTGGTARTVVFTRTKHGAKKLARQLNNCGVNAVELHGNLSQNARTRHLDAFHSGEATTLVATDIAARGIHVDDVGLVLHADPPVEHKAYLHRSGRTARAGAAGTVVTLMTDAQVHDVRALTKAAGINPTMTRVDPSHPLLGSLAPLGSAGMGVAPVLREPAGSAAAPRSGGSENSGRNDARNRPRRKPRSNSGEGSGQSRTSAPRTEQRGSTPRPARSESRSAAVGSGVRSASTRTSSAASFSTRTAVGGRR